MPVSSEGALSPDADDMHILQSLLLQGLNERTKYAANSVYSAFEGTIRVLVGPKRVVFDVHKAMLCESSSFFQKAINGPFREAEKKEIELPFDEPHIFTGILNWIYRKAFDPDLDAVTWLDLAKLWIIADKFDIPVLRHRVILAICQKHWKLVAINGPSTHCRGVANISPATVDHIYECTRDDAGLRHVIVALFVDSIPLKQLQDRIADFPADFLADVFGICWAEKMNGGPKNAITKISNKTVDLCTKHAPSVLGEFIPIPIAYHKVTCDGPECDKADIKGTRYRCYECDDRDFCSDCKNVQIPGHDSSHILIELKTPTASHTNVYCDGPFCVRKGNKFCIQGTRYKYNDCADHDYCDKCKMAPTTCSTKHVLTAIDDPTPHKFVPTLRYLLGSREYNRRRQAGLCVNCEGSEHNTNTCNAPFKGTAHADPDD
jgi:hypothetical protein